MSFCTFEVASLVNVLGHYLRKYGSQIFHFSTLWIWLFGIFDKPPQGCDEVKNSMGPRLMAWTLKSSIQGNHWVPLDLLRWNGQKSANYRRVNWEKWEGANMVPQRHLQFLASLYLTPKYLTPNNTRWNI